MLGIKHPSQFVRLVCPILAPQKLQGLIVRDEWALARFGRTRNRNTRWRSGGGLSLVLVVHYHEYEPGHKQFQWKLVRLGATR